SDAIPDRHIFCLDLRAYDDPQVYVNEIRRITQEASVKFVPLAGLIQEGTRPAQFQQFTIPGKDDKGFVITGEPRAQRWYPVIDYTRCTNCLECIDFCLFGVYGIDKQDTILIEQPDNCRKGCPACSRVCPENAIIFPLHKSPAIAGGNEVAGSLKIDLSLLFGAPATGESAVDVAVKERDEQLLLAGREAVGT